MPWISGLLVADPHQTIFDDHRVEHHHRRSPLPNVRLVLGQTLGHRAVAAAAITLLSLLVMLGPATWLALSLADTVRTVLARLGDGTLTFPPPSDAVKAWPLIGEKIYESWLLASTNLRALVIEAAPHLKPLGSSLLNAAGSIGINLLKFVIAVVISGFLLIPGPSLIHSIKNLLSLVAAARGQGHEGTDAGHIGRCARGHARAWRDWFIRRPDRAFDCLAIARGLDTRRADSDGGGQVSPPNWISRSSRTSGQRFGASPKVLVVRPSPPDLSTGGGLGELLPDEDSLYKSIKRAQQGS